MTVEPRGKPCPRCGAASLGTLDVDHPPGSCEDRCSCGKVVLNTGPGREVVGRDWHDDCPVHGVGSEWYEREGKARLEATRQRSIDLQRQASEARRKWKEDHPDG